MQYFSIKDWSKFQHFRDRRPPWIKLYRDILDDIQWHELDPLSAKTLIMLWLIASEDNGMLPCSKELSFRLRISEKQVESIVSRLSRWLEQDDINMISNGYRDDRTETETETEGETERETKARTRKPPAFVLPDSILPEIWQAFEEHRNKMRKPMTDRARILIVKKLETLGGDHNALLDQSIRKGWQDVFPLKPTIPDEPSKEKKEELSRCQYGDCNRKGTAKIGNSRYCSEHLEMI